MDYAAFSLYFYSDTAIYGCGENINKLEKSVRTYIRRAIQFKQDMVVKFLLAIHQLVLDLTGSCESSYSLFYDGETKTEDSFLLDAIQKHESLYCLTLYVKQKYAAVMMNQMDTAAELYDLVLKYQVKGAGRVFGVINTTFVDGLIAFDAARRLDEDRAK